MALDCLPAFRFGRLVFERWPDGGTWYTQDDQLLAALRISFHGWRLWSSGNEWGAAEAKLAAWILADDDADD